MPQSIPIAFKAIGKPEIGHNNYAGFQPGKTEVLPKGWSGFNAKPLASDIRVDHDIEFKTRDGSRLYADIYRPEGFEQEKLPAIISWSPYGKKYSALAMLPMCVWNCCVSKEDLSGTDSNHSNVLAEVSHSLLTNCTGCRHRKVRGSRPTSLVSQRVCCHQCRCARCWRQRWFHAHHGLSRRRRLL